MLSIKPLEFANSGIKGIQQEYYGKEKWPVVYIIHNDQEAYIGETVDAVSRISNHLANPKRQPLTKLQIISDEEFNKSATLEIEASLINYMSSDGVFKLQNGNMGLTFHKYYQQSLYQEKFNELWQLLIREKIARNGLSKIKNSDLFKYSPYKSLSQDQLEALKTILGVILDNVVKERSQPFVVEGGAGTGKTVLAIFLMKLLNSDISENDDIEKINELKDGEEILENLKKIKSQVKLSVGLVIPMTSLRKTIKKVFKQISGLNPGMVIGPSDVAKNIGKFDLLIVDEAHRLSSRGRMGIIAKTNKKLDLPKSATQLDWLLVKSKFQVLFYDSGQTIKPGDVSFERFKGLINTKQSFKLKSQLRVKSVDYVEYIENLFDCKLSEKAVFTDYDFKLFDSIEEFDKQIKQKEKEAGLSRIVAGFAWKWKTKKNRADYDIEIDGKCYRWNSTIEDWVNSPNASNEVGCIHTTQGYDLNYTGVIIGPEISYDKKLNRIVVNRAKYFDQNGRTNGGEDKNDERLTVFIKNIYKTLFKRGISGTYVYICDKNLREYFGKFIEPGIIAANKQEEIVILESIEENKKFYEYLPVFTLKAAAGKFMGNSGIESEGWVKLPLGIKPGDKYLFVAKVCGKSMEPVIKDGSLCVFRFGVHGSRENKKVLVYHKDIADSENGGNFSVKEYHSNKQENPDGTWQHTEIVLKSLNRDYNDIIIKVAEESEFLVVAELVPGKIENEVQSPGK